jgi:hypothetical protein
MQQPARRLPTGGGGAIPAARPTAGGAAVYFMEQTNRIALGIDDTARATTALRGVVGKRLTYRRPDSGLTASA